MDKFRTKRVYESPDSSDGVRVLVDRIWPRGVTKEKAQLTIWMKGIAPSAELRMWFGHMPERFAEFKLRYEAELRSDKAKVHLEQLCLWATEKPVTLLYSAIDDNRNQAVVLKQYLEQRYEPYNGLAGRNMNVISTMERRREITKFKEFPIPDELLEKLVHALYLSPSGNNLPSREFVLITNRPTLIQLSLTTPYMKWLDHAAAGVVIIGNDQISKYWLQDASIAGGYLWLAATSLGLGAAWGAVYHAEDSEESMSRENYVRSLLQIPVNLRVVAIIGLGYPDIEPQPKQMYPLKTVYHREAYNMIRGV
jgi:uncharacterized protein YeaO (DUF488 family)/nitroreductase